MKKLNKNKGITLIALVISIIVMLILVAVSISMAVNGGLFNYAGKAAGDTQKAMGNEQLVISDWIEDIESGLNVKKVTDENPGVLEGEGTEEDPYTINSIEDLVVFSYNVTNGNTYEGKYVKLGISLNFKSSKSYVNAVRTDYEQYGYSGELITALISGEGFSTIGTRENYFKGTFDGNNETISNLYINVQKDEKLEKGLFARISGNIENLGLINVNIQVEGTSIDVGAVCGRCYGNIKNCYAQGEIICKGTIWTDGGGICGRLKEEGYISKCYNLANVYVENNVALESNGEAKGGGIVGNCYSIIEECYNKGNINTQAEKCSSSCGRNCWEHTGFKY